MRRISQFRRITTIHHIIKSSGGFSYSKLKSQNSHHLSAIGEVSNRTIQRDIEKLRYDFNAPVTYDRSKKAYVYTDNTFELPLAVLSTQELIHLVLGKVLLEQFKGTDWRQTLNWLFDRLKQLNYDAFSLVDLERILTNQTFSYS